MTDGTQGVGYYRILARGTGMHPTSISVTESIVARPWGGDYLLSQYPPVSGPDTFCVQFEPDLEAQLDCGQLAWRQRR